MSVRLEQLSPIRCDKKNIPINIEGRGLYSIEKDRNYMGEVTEVSLEGDVILDGGPGRIKNWAINHYRTGPIRTGDEE